MTKSKTKPEKLASGDFLARATLHWTPARTAKVTAGKKYPLLPHAAPLLLRELGLLNQDASMSADAVRKYTQINHLLLQLTPALEELVKQHSVVRVLDAGAGKSYTSFLLAWALTTLWSKDCEVLGVDAQARLMEAAKRRSATLGLASSLAFATSTLATLDWLSTQIQHFPAATTWYQAGKILRPHLVIALHACDSATDDALALAVRLKSDVIAVAPCCQAELARHWRALTNDPLLKEHPLAPVFHAPELRRHIAADCTDMLRVLLLRAHGYEVTSTEFVASEHTSKNRLLLATRRGRFLATAAAEYHRLKAALGDPQLALERAIALPSEI